MLWVFYPAGDATALKQLLEGRDFKVILQLNLDFAAFDDAIAELKAVAGQAGEVFVFYAGHGVHADSADPMAPVDFDDTCPEADDEKKGRMTPRRGMRLARLTANLGGAATRTVVVIDACRSEPYAPRCQGRGDGGADAGGLRFRDLVRVEPATKRPPVVNSTEPGSRALDGFPGQPHSPYLMSFLKVGRARPAPKFSPLLRLVAAGRNCGFEPAPPKWP